MRYTHRNRRWRALTVGLAVVALLAACAPEPVVGWAPAGFAPVPGVALTAGQLNSSAGSGSVGGSGTGSATGSGRDSDTDSGEDRVSGDSTSAVAPTPDQYALGLYTGRLRNDAIGFAARFVYIPGVPAFNTRVSEELRAAITATGSSYAPQTYAPEPGRTERGCVPGSASLPAEEVLSGVETGPVGGAGIAVTCELAGAYGNLIEVRLRVVAGSAGGVTQDRLSVLFVDVASGQLIEVADAWNDTAAPELWRSVVELLRRNAGSLSTARIADPGEEQLALASTALHATEDTIDGGLAVTMPPGIASPELMGLGIEATTEPITLRIDQATAIAWSNEQYRQLHAELGKPFVGLSSKVSAVTIDCNLIPCVAVTYDDGPSELTPQLLDTLAAERGRATFFMLSSHATANPETVKRAIVEGNEVATHTINHPDLTMIPLPEAKAQVLDSAAAISGITGKPVTMFRPPYGEVNDKILEAVGMPAILWNIDTNDWRLPGKQALIDRSAAVAEPGDIILFHDTHSDTVEAAADVVRGLHDRGLELVTVTQLFGGQVPGGRVRAR